MKLALLFAPVLAYGQLQVSLVTVDGSRPLNPSTSLGSLPGGDALDTLYEIRGAATGAAAMIDLLEINGSGFSMLSRPALPAAVNSGGFVNFGLRFMAAGSGAYSAILKVNTNTYILRVNVFATAKIKFDGKVLAAGSVADFGTTQRGTRMPRTFELANESSESVTVAAIATAGLFAAASLPSLPLEMKPGEIHTFEVAFTPTASRREDGMLTIDSRAIRLTGSGTEPPLPSGRLDLNGDSRSNQQVQARVRLDDRSAGNGAGQLQLGFQPDAGLTDDPAIVFTANATRMLRFNIAEGDTAGPEAVFQTGTTAGAIVLTLQLGEFTKVLSIQVPGAAIGIDSATGERGANTVTLRLAGFDNTRSATETQFTFYDRNGTVIGGAPVRSDNAAAFKQFFQASGLGGVFQLNAVFPVAGDISQIDSAEIAMTNSRGVARTQRVKIN